MVKISTRRKLIRELEVIIRFLIIDEKENTDEFSEIMDIYIKAYVQQECLMRDHLFLKQVECVISFGI